MKKSFSMITGLLIGSACAVSLLTSCAVSSSSEQQYTVNNAACTVSQQDVRRSMLSQKGVRVEKVGDHVFLIFTSRYVFSNSTSAKLNQAFVDESIPVVADYLACFNKSNVTITAYTNVFSTKAQNLLLSQQQAQSVMNSLWNHGINSNITVAVGGGSATQKDDVGPRRLVIAVKLRQY